MKLAGMARARDIAVRCPGFLIVSEELQPGYFTPAFEWLSERSRNLQVAKARAGFADKRNLKFADTQRVKYPG